MATKQAKVEIATRHLPDGGFIHELTYTNGQKRTVAIAPDHELYHQFAAHGSKAKLLASANSADDADTAVQKVDALVDAFDEGKWSLLGEGSPKFTPLVRALAELKGIKPEDADVIVKGLSKSAQAKLRGTERIATLIASYKKNAVSEGDAVLDNLLKDDEGIDASERQPG